MGHLVMPHWGRVCVCVCVCVFVCVIWEQRKCSSLEDVICRTSLKTTVTPAGRVKLFSCSKLGASQRIKRENDGKALLEWGFLGGGFGCLAPWKWIIFVRVWKGQKYCIGLHLMCSIDCGNVINTLTADICRVPVCVSAGDWDRSLFQWVWEQRMEKRGEHVGH